MTGRDKRAWVREAGGQQSSTETRRIRREARRSLEVMELMTDYYECMDATELRLEMSVVISCIMMKAVKDNTAITPHSVRVKMGRQRGPRAQVPSSAEFSKPPRKTSTPILIGQKESFTIT